MDEEKYIKLKSAFESEIFKDIPKWKKWLWDMEYYIQDFFWKLFGRR